MAILFATNLTFWEAPVSSDTVFFFLLLLFCLFIVLFIYFIYLFILGGGGGGEVLTLAATKSYNLGNIITETKYQAGL